MFNESVLSKQNIERWYPLAENKVEETHENQAKQISFLKFQANILSKMFALTSGKIKYLVFFKEPPEYNVTALTTHIQ